jgi:tetratricopeptide (TPR) repeat protein
MLRWRQEPSDAEYDLYERFRQAAVRLDPKSAPMWIRFGDDERAAYEKQPRQDRLRRTIQSYRRAVELYPTSATGRAKLALAYQTSGDQEAFRRERDRAIEFDRLTPHADKKLPDELRRRLLRN